MLYPYYYHCYDHCHYYYYYYDDDYYYKNFQDSLKWILDTLSPTAGANRFTEAGSVRSKTSIYGLGMAHGSGRKLKFCLSGTPSSCCPREVGRTEFGFGFQNREGPEFDFGFACNPLSGRGLT